MKNADAPASAFFANKKEKSETQTFAAAEKREFLHVIPAYTANQYILPPVYQRFLERELPVNLRVQIQDLEGITWY